MSQLQDLMDAYEMVIEDLGEQQRQAESLGREKYAEKLYKGRCILQHMQDTSLDFALRNEEQT